MNNKEIYSDIDFYYSNLKNGYKINLKAKENLLEATNYDYDLLVELKNYDEIGIAEYVANNQFYIDYDEKIIMKEDE